MRLTTSLPSHAVRHEIWEPKPPGTLWATPGLLREPLPYIIFMLFPTKCYAMYNFFFLGLNNTHVLHKECTKFKCPTPLTKG